MKYAKILRNFIVGVVILLLLIAMVVIVIDPFYHYHKPLFGTKAVLTEKEYQCIGSLKHFDYDAVIVGSSVAENYNNHWFDEDFSCNSIKAIRSYGATADLCYFLDVALENNDIKYVFYNIDPSALTSMPYETFEETGCPMYLYDDNPFNDVEYLYNKDVLLSRIPYTLAKSLSNDVDEGESYNWGQWKEFNLDMITGLYMRHPSVAPMKDVHAYDESFDANLELLESRVADNPDTQFYFFIPPYSMFWWDNVYREGDTEFYLYAIEETSTRLRKYDNVRFSCFIDDRDVVTNVEENYMDVLHFRPEINHYMEKCLADGSMEINDTNIRERMDNMRSLAYEITDKLMEPYVPMIKEDIE